MLFDTDYCVARAFLCMKQNNMKSSTTAIGLSNINWILALTEAIAD